MQLYWGAGIQFQEYYIYDEFSIMGILKQVEIALDSDCFQRFNTPFKVVRSLLALANVDVLLWDQAMANTHEDAQREYISTNWLIDEAGVKKS